MLFKIKKDRVKNLLIINLNPNSNNSLRLLILVVKNLHMRNKLKICPKMILKLVEKLNKLFRLVLLNLPLKIL